MTGSLVTFRATTTPPEIIFGIRWQVVLDEGPVSAGEELPLKVRCGEGAEFTDSVDRPGKFTVVFWQDLDEDEEIGAEEISDSACLSSDVIRLNPYSFL